MVTLVLANCLPSLTESSLFDVEFRNKNCFEQPDTQRGQTIYLSSLFLDPFTQRGISRALPMRFVIAEDDGDLRFIIERLLSEAFPEIEVAAYVNGKDALEDFDCNGACLVVSNHSMPIMDGPTFVSHLRKRSAFLPILMVSGSPEAQAEGKAAGISCFLNKDEMPARLAATVRALLERHRSDGPVYASDQRETSRSGI